MKKFRVTQDANYIQGYLRLGFRTGVIEAESEADALDKLKNKGYTDYLDLKVTDYRVEDVDYDGQEFKIKEIKG